MKLRHICEAKTQAELDQEANQQRQDQIRQVLEAAEKAFLNSSVARIMEDSNKTFKELLTLARNEADLIHEDKTLQTKLLNCMTEINSKIIKVSITSSGHTQAVEDWWAEAIEGVRLDLISVFSKLKLESKQYTIEEGILSSIGGLFVKVIGFLIKTTAAGLAAGAAFGAAIAGNRQGYGGGYGRSSGRAGEKRQGEIEMKYKIALMNAKFIDAYLLRLKPTAEAILKDPGVQTVLTPAPTP